MADKPKMSKETREKLKNEIDNLLSSMDHSEHDDAIVDDRMKDALKLESKIDFEKMESDLMMKSRDITDSLLKYYVDLGIIDDNDYIKHKKEMDTIHLSNMFFQIKTIKMTITQIMEEIMTGNRSTKLMEVMGNLQDKLKSLTQAQANYMLFLEETYKKINNEAPVNSNDAEIKGINKKEGEYFITVGTKSTVENLEDVKSEIKQDEIEDDLIDPSNKTNLMKLNNIEIEEEDDRDDFIDVSDVI